MSTKPALTVEKLDLEWRNTQRTRRRDGCEHLVLQTDRGDIAARYHPATPEWPQLPGAALWVGGGGGGLDGPAGGLYPSACERLQERGVAGLRLDYRHPNDLIECVLDTLLGVQFLDQEGVHRVVLIGHSFGGAVVITAGAMAKNIAGIIPMSTQSYGTELAPELSPRPLLLIHGTDDEILSDACSRRVYAVARQPKELVLFRGAHHGLDEVREELLELLITWIARNLGRYPGE